jgi:hypothetical protein
METLFAHSYILIFGKLAVGGAIALAVPDSALLERGYYKSTAAVFIGCVMCMAGGQLYLLLNYPGQGIPSPLEVSAWCFFCTVFVIYFITLFTDMALIRARVFPLLLLSSLLAVSSSAWVFASQNGGPLTGLVFSAALFSGSLIVGATLSGMLLGHWYLIDTGMDLAPFKQILKWCKGCLLAAIVTACLSTAVVGLLDGNGANGAVRVALAAYPWLVFARVFCWVLTGVLFILIEKTLEIPQTMAATGLFYIAALGAAVGEIASHWLLFRTGIPL